MVPEVPKHTLEDFIAEKMSMSHIHQPAMLRVLLENGGEASVEEIAKPFLLHDISQVEYYSMRTNNMVGRVLRDHGIVRPVKKGRHYGSTDLFQRDSYQDQFDMKFSRGPNTDASFAVHMNLKQRCMWTTSFQGQMEAAMTLPISSVFVSNATRTNETMTIRISGAFIRVMQSGIRTACSAT